MSKSSNWESTIKPIVVLSVISLIASLLLALVNGIMGFDANGAETGIWVDASTQTKGIGSNVASEDYLAQFDGMDGTQNIVMNQDYDAYSGATISSTALFAAINDCVNCYNELA